MNRSSSRAAARSRSVASRRASGLLGLAVAGLAPPWLAAQEAAPSPGQGDAPAAAAPARPGLEAHFPADTLFFLGVDDLAEFQRACGESAWGRLYRDPGAQAVRTAFDGLLTSLGAMAERESGVNLIDTVNLVQGRAAMGSRTRPRTTEAPGSAADIVAFFAVDAGSQVQELRERVTRMFAKAIEAGRMVLKQESEGDIEVVHAAPAGDDPQGEARFATHGSTLLCELAEAPIPDGRGFAQLLAHLTGTDADTLAQTGNFKESLADQPGGLKLWFDIGTLLRREAAQQTEGEQATLATLGVDRLGALAARVALDASGMHVAARIGWEGQGLVPRFADALFADAEPSLFRFVPADAAMAVQFSLDFAAGIAAQRELMKLLGADDLFADEPAADGAAGDGAAPPVSFEKDVLEQLDGRIAFFAAPVDVTEALPLSLDEPTSVCLVAGVKSAEALRTAVDKLLRQQGLHAARRRTEFEGFQVYTLPIAGFSVHYVILDDLLMVSMSGTLLQDALRRKAHAELPSLLQDQAFLHQIEGLPARHALLVWTRMSLVAQDSAADAAAMRAALAGDLEGTGEPVTVALAALAEALAAIDPALAVKHLPVGSLFSVGVDPTGVRLEGVAR